MGVLDALLEALPRSVGGVQSVLVREVVFDPADALDALVFPIGLDHLAIDLQRELGLLDDLHVGLGVLVHLHEDVDVERLPRPEFLRDELPRSLGLQATAEDVMAGRKRRNRQNCWI